MAMSMRTEALAPTVDLTGVATPTAGGRSTVEDGLRAMPAPQQSWGEIVEATTRMLSRPGGLGGGQRRDSESVLNQMTGLLKLQTEVTQYQLRIEFASKACESFTASLRKLQQQQ
jgi:hypothetical protein